MFTQLAHGQACFLVIPMVTSKHTWQAIGPFWSRWSCQQASSPWVLLTRLGIRFSFWFLCFTHLFRALSGENTCFIPQCLISLFNCLISRHV